MAIKADDLNFDPEDLRAVEGRARMILEVGCVGTLPDSS